MVRRRLLSSLAAAASRHAAPLSFSDSWAPARVAYIGPATADETLFHLSLEVSSQRAVQFRSPGQFLPLRLPSRASSPPLVLSIASPPHLAQSHSLFHLLVKRVTGSLSDALCAMSPGDLLEVGAVMGNGFDVPRLSDSHMLFIFATGSGISPIRSLLESAEFNHNFNAQVRLYYGATNLHRMPYQDRFKYWESTSVKVIPVLSQPDETWTGARGYVQTAFLREKQILRPSSTGAVLCGHRHMTEEITSILLAKGVSKEKILTTDLGNYHFLSIV